VTSHSNKNENAEHRKQTYMTMRFYFLLQSKPAALEKVQNNKLNTVKLGSLNAFALRTHTKVGRDRDAVTALPN
jgi:hypothetical protein